MSENKFIAGLPVLYSKNSREQVIEWYIQVVELPNGHYEIEKFSGLYGRAKDNVPNTYLVTEGKNIGKSNETTVKEQAIKVAQAEFDHKLKRDGYYQLEVGETQGVDKETYLLNKIPGKRDAEGFIKPMKAQQYWKETKKEGKIPRIKFPCIGQYKINGVRAMIHYENDKVIIKSKNGLRYNLPNIEADYLKVYTSGHVPLDTVFDGELYFHGWILSKISGAARRSEKNYDPNSTSAALNHITFDIVGDEPQNTRIATLDWLAEHYKNLNYVMFLDSFDIKDHETAETFTKHAIEKGYEGAIFRDPKAKYQAGKRPQTIVKLKVRESAEFEIIDVVGMDKAPDLGMFVCKNDKNNLTFTVVPEGNYVVKRQYLNDRDKLIGKQLTVEFYERTKDDLPFHAVGITVRDYE
jgi:ATP-dependent DNA ligase